MSGDTKTDVEWFDENLKPSEHLHEILDCYGVSTQEAFQLYFSVIHLRHVWQNRYASTYLLFYK